MDVSNSTGQNTGYRVLGSAGSGNLVDRDQEWMIKLEAWQREECKQPVPSTPFRVQFFVGDLEVACATFVKEPEVVTLHEDEWGYRVQPENGKAATAS